jgi:hypothetical protein
MPFEHWKTAGTWLRSPILIAGEVMGLSLEMPGRIHPPRKSSGIA